MRHRHAPKVSPRPARAPRPSHRPATPRPSGALVIAAAAALGLVTPAARAASPIPIYGSPYTVGQYGPYNAIGVAHNPGAPVNAAGTAITYASVWNGYRAIAWNSAGTTPTLLPPSAKSDSTAFTQPWAVNAAGVVVGQADMYGTGDVSNGTRAVRWDTAGNPTVLAPLATGKGGYTQGYARAITDAGVVIGVYDRYDASGTYKALWGQAVRWDAAGTPQELPALGGASAPANTVAEPNAINASNVVVGTSYKYGPTGTYLGSRAVRWDAAGNVQEMGAINTTAAGVTHAEAFAVNAAGVSVGHADKYSGDALLGQFPVRWDTAGSALELGMLPTGPGGVSEGHAYAINESGFAAGYVKTYPGNFYYRGWRAVRWDPDGTVHELANLGVDSVGDTNCQAYAINAGNVAVGYATAFPDPGGVGRSHAVYWTADGSVVDLNSLIDPTSGWTLSEADGITDNGWIVGKAYYDPDGSGPQGLFVRAFSMQVPGAVPEPGGALATAALAGSAWGLARRRQHAPAR